MSIFLVEQFKTANLKQIIFIDQNPATISLKTRNRHNEIGKYDERAKSLATVDIAIIGSSNHGYSITKEMVESALKVRQYKPILIIDIGVPSAVDPAIERIDEAFIYDLDDFERVALEGKNKRSSAIVDAENIIQETKNQNINSLVQDISNSMNEERLKLLKEKPLLNPSETSQLLLKRLLHKTIITLRELSLNNELDRKTEFLIRKLLISKNLYKGDSGEL
jgi:glutamyl-tRNA reductase